MGATVLQVSPGYLAVVAARAKAYCLASGAHLLPFGADTPEAIAIIADAARQIDVQPAEVWCAAGSGVLMRGLAQAWPKARRHAVQIGRTLSAADVAGATIHVFPKPYDFAFRGSAPFPSDPHYDAKAFEICAREHGRGLVLFWNVTGPAS
jgi:histidinol-phosphate/aromatic aminotransferase/cobyric acid decarboxylase-like protein